MIYELKTPISEEDIRKIKVGDTIYITGEIITARDEAHVKALELHEKGEALPVSFEGKGLYHCGPIIKKVDDEWKVIAAGPTTSMRMELFEDEFIEKFKPRVIIGKGGMGEKTAKACKEHGAVFGLFTGGAALLAAKRIKRVKAVYWLEELGMPECLWVFEVEKFGPLTVTIDAEGNNLTEEVNKKVFENLEKITTEVI